MRYFFISTFISLRTAYTILGSVLGSKNESFFDPFDLTSMMLLLIVVYTNQKNFTAIILQAIQIIFLFNLLHCLFCGMPPLQFNNQSRQITISIWLKCIVLCDFLGILLCSKELYPASGNASWKRVCRYCI